MTGMYERNGDFPSTGVYTELDSKNVTPSPRSLSTYRPEIDGLRALAVMAVIINHFNPDLLPSGFLGVDIFFVISGFVVTASLAKKTDGLSWQAYLLTFYSRRIKRLFPALATCVVLTSLVGCLFIDQPATSLKTGIASLVGFSNLYLFKQSTDYFGQVAEFNLFTQTWSLGVEEQFYLVFPILLGICGFSRQRRSKGKRTLLLAVLGLSVLSLVSYLYLAKFSVSAAFFLMPARFWELGAGCLTFLAAGRLSQYFSSPRVQTLAPWICSLLLIGVLFASKDFQIVSTLTTAFLTCILLGCLNAKSVLFKVFSHRRIVQVGLLSYSLYLWHWSVLVISRWTIGVSKWTIPLQVLLMVGLALASYNWIEQPLRYAQWSTAKYKTIGYGLGSSFCAGVLLLGLLQPMAGNLYLGQRFPESDITSFKLAKDYEVCRDARSVSANFAECAYPPGPASTSLKTVYFVGDSHTLSLQALASRLVEQGQAPRIVMVARNKCLFSPSLVRGLENGHKLRNCLESSQSFLSNVLETGHAGDIVVVTNRDIAYFLTPNYGEDALRVQRGDFSLHFNDARLSQEQALDVYTNDLIDMAQQLTKRGIALVIQAPLPDWQHLPHECQPEWFRTSMALPKTCQLTTDSESKSRLPVLTAFRQADIAADNLYLYDPFVLFCGAKHCSPFSGEGIPLFKDDDHLNNYGAETLHASFVEFLQQQALL